MSDFNDLFANMPKGERQGGNASRAEAVKARKLSVAIKVLTASLNKQVLLQKSDLSTLADASELKTTTWLGNFLGAGRGGLCLDLTRHKGDWVIHPSPLQALRAWAWIKKLAKQDIPNVLEAINIKSESEIEEQIARDVLAQQAYFGHERPNG